MSDTNSTELPEVAFGDEPPMDWRTLPEDESPDDDELLPQSPDDVVEILGFDPLDLGVMELEEADANPDNRR